VVQQRSFHRRHAVGPSALRRGSAASVVSFASLAALALSLALGGIRTLRRLRFEDRNGSLGFYALSLAILAPAICVAFAVCTQTPSADVVAEPTPNVPTDVMFYTHVLYGGDDAYLVDGHWYRPAENGWVVFTQEPLELALVRRSAELDRRSSILGALGL
jgi:hypothetical protein